MAISHEISIKIVDSQVDGFPMKTKVKRAFNEPIDEFASHGGMNIWVEVEYVTARHILEFFSSHVLHHHANFVLFVKILQSIMKELL